MSANINSMFYTGEKPWHGLGTKLEKAATAAEAIEAAGLNYGITKQPIFVQSPQGPIAVPNQFATVRMDNNQPLGVVGDVYRVLQNREAFSFFDAVVGIKEAIYHTAGALGNGSLIWVLAKLNGLIQVTKDDVTEKFLLLTNRHDGNGSVRMMFTPIRVVCQNTLNAALSGNELQASIRHTASMGLKVQQVRDVLGIVNAKYELFGEAARKLAAVQLTQEALKTFYTQAGVIPEDLDSLEGRSKTLAEQMIQDVMLRFEHGKGNDMPGVKGTLWAAYNSITEYVDYGKATRGGDDGRARSLLFGAGAALKQKAWDAALALAR